MKYKVPIFLWLVENIQRTIKGFVKNDIEAVGITKKKIIKKA